MDSTENGDERCGGLPLLFRQCAVVRSTIVAFEPVPKFGRRKGDSRALFAFVALERRDSFPVNVARDGASAQGSDFLKSLNRWDQVFLGVLGNHF